MIYIGIDDTDNLESRGTGNLARNIAAQLSRTYPIAGVVRHQLCKDPCVPCTKNNSCATILLQGEAPLEEIFKQVSDWMLADFQPGSDPGLCVAQEVPIPVQEFGVRVKQEIVTYEQAQQLARKTGLHLAALGGDGGGIIGALAAVGLAASGEDGRYIHVGHIRELSGWQPVPALLEAGVVEVISQAGVPIQQGLVMTDKLRPARRGGRPVAIVAPAGENWQFVKLD